jgi:hypothetical protein
MFAFPQAGSHNVEVDSQTNPCIHFCPGGN